jgi:hypothetical protein
MAIVLRAQQSLEDAVDLGVDGMAHRGSLGPTRDRHNGFHTRAGRGMCPARNVDTGGESCGLLNPCCQVPNLSSTIQAALEEHRRTRGPNRKLTKEPVAIRLSHEVQPTSPFIGRR